LMLWEIFTGKKAWKDFLDEVQWNASVFSDELCNKGKLPVMEKSIPPQIQAVIVSCLKTESADRPTFSELVDRLINAQIDYFLNIDPAAANFWKTHWLKYKWEGNNKVSWEKFQAGLKSFLGIQSDTDPVWNTLKERLVTDDAHVTLSTLERALLWFGALKSPDGETIFSRIQKYITSPGFHFAQGSISALVTEQMLSNEPTGSFFIRLNEGHNSPVKEAPWTLSVKIKKEVKHYRVTLSENGELALKSDTYILKNKHITSLFQLIHQLQADYPKDFAKPLITTVVEPKY